MIKGNVWVFDNNVDTDQIIPSQYLLLPTIDEMKKYTFEPINKNFSSEIKSGDIIVAGENFGCGSSREQAPRVLKELGVRVIVAKSFSRIFFRNAINIGLAVVICKDLREEVTSVSCINVDIEQGKITNLESGKEYYSTKLSNHMMKILNSGGLIEYLNQRDGKGE